MSKESFPIKTRLAAGFMMLGAGATALTGCSSNSGNTLKPSHAAKISETSPVPTHSSSSTKPKPSTSSPKPTVSPSSKLTASDIEQINFCDFPTIIDIVKKAGDDNLACDPELDNSSTGLSYGTRTYFFDKNLTIGQRAPANAIATISIAESFSGEFSGYQQSSAISVVDGRPCNWSTSSFGNDKLGLTCELGNSDDPNNPSATTIARVSISSRGMPTTYELHEQLMQTTLGSISTKGNLELTSDNKAPTCIQQQAC